MAINNKKSKNANHFIANYRKHFAQTAQRKKKNVRYQNCPFPAEKEKEKPTDCPFLAKKEKTKIAELKKEKIAR